MSLNNRFNDIIFNQSLTYIFLSYLEKKSVKVYLKGKLPLHNWHNKDFRLMVIKFLQMSSVCLVSDRFTCISVAMYLIFDQVFISSHDLGHMIWATCEHTLLIHTLPIHTLPMTLVRFVIIVTGDLAWSRYTLVIQPGMTIPNNLGIIKYGSRKTTCI